MRRKIDPMFRRPAKQHKIWLRAVHASLQGRSPSPLEDFGITSKRIEILFDMGLVERKNGLYVLTEKGKSLI